MKKIIVFKGAVVEYDDKLEKKGISISANTGPPVEVVEATEENRTKYIKNKKYPPAK